MSDTIPLPLMDDVAQVREKTDIVSLLSEFLPLKKMGRNFNTNCPFHNEKTPSFVVSPERQIWHCFGCSKGGDVFTFLMEFEHIEFAESLRMLAKRAGVILKEYKGGDKASIKKEEIYKINALAGEFYHYILTKHPVGKKALAYLSEERGISEAVIKTFQIGFAPKSGTSLVSYLLTKKRFNKEDVIDAGLTSFRGGRLSDFFVNRIMFPIVDHRDNVIGFSGRVLDETSQMGKYINTRETIAYHKGEVFFGLHTARAEIKKENNALIMEGEFDIISAFSEGLTNAIAIKGTALTENQVNLLSRFCSKVTLCFDQDTAGQLALQKSVPLLEKKGFTIVVVQSQEGKDPDEAIRINPYGFKQAVKHAVSVYDYLIEQGVKMYGKNSEGKKLLSDSLLPLFAGIENEIVKEHYLRLLAKTLDTSYESIEKQLEKTLTKTQPATKSQQQKEKKEREELMEEYLLSLIVQSSRPKEAVEIAVSVLSVGMPKERAYQKILSHLLEHFETQDAFDGGKFSHKLPQELVKTYDTCFLYPLPKFSDEKSYDAEVKKTAEQLQSFYIRSKLKKLSDQIKEKEQGADGGGDEDAQLVSLQEEFSELSSKLGKEA